MACKCWQTPPSKVQGCNPSCFLEHNFHFLQIQGHFLKQNINFWTQLFFAQFLGDRYFIQLSVLSVRSPFPRKWPPNCQKWPKMAFSRIWTKFYSETLSPYSLTLRPQNWKSSINHRSLSKRLDKNLIHWPLTCFPKFKHAEGQGCETNLNSFWILTLKNCNERHAQGMHRINLEVEVLCCTSKWQ